MKIKSLAYQTDMIYPAFDGEIIDLETLVIVVEMDSTAEKLDWSIGTSFIEHQLGIRVG